MNTFNALQRAILETLVYSDIFEYPMRLEEVHRYLPVLATMDEVCAEISCIAQVDSRASYYFLKGRDELVDIRLQREVASRKVFRHAMFYGRVLGQLPFIRMTALTGSLAMLNLSKNPDMDYMLVAAHGRVWTARAFAILLGKFSKLFGDTICPNVIISECVLEWPMHDLYSAREFCQMIPITGLEIYQRLREVNAWTQSCLPNANDVPQTSNVHAATNFMDFPLKGNLGDRIENWEMTRKIEKFSKQAGFGEETIFTADVCQGNFDHHRRWTKEAFEKRLVQFDIQNSAE